MDKKKSERLRLIILVHFSAVLLNYWGDKLYSLFKIECLIFYFSTLVAANVSIKISLYFEQKYFSFFLGGGFPSVSMFLKTPIFCMVKINLVFVSI